MYKKIRLWSVALVIVLASCSSGGGVYKEKMDAAQQAMDDGRYGEAVSLYRQALQAKNGDEEALGKLFLAERRAEEEGQSEPEAAGTEAESDPQAAETSSETPLTITMIDDKYYVQGITIGNSIDDAVAKLGTPDSNAAGYALWAFDDGYPDSPNGLSVSYSDDGTITEIGGGKIPDDTALPLIRGLGLPDETEGSMYAFRTKTQRIDFLDNWLDEDTHGYSFYLGSTSDNARAAASELPVQEPVLAEEVPVAEETLPQAEQAPTLDMDFDDMNSALSAALGEQLAPLGYELVFDTLGFDVLQDGYFHVNLLDTVEVIGEVMPDGQVRWMAARMESRILDPEEAAEMANYYTAVTRSIMIAMGDESAMEDIFNDLINQRYNAFKEIGAYSLDGRTYTDAGSEHYSIFAVSDSEDAELDLKTYY